MSTRQIFVISFIVFCSTMFDFVQAHEGEQHAEEPTAVAVPQTGEGLESEGAETETFELVIKHSPLDIGKPQKMTLFLNDFGSNEPVSNAKINIQIQGANSPDVEATPTKSPGVYEAQISFPSKGETTLSFNVKTSDFDDTLIINNIHVGMNSKGKLKFSKSVWIGSFIGIILIGAAGFYFWRKMRIKLTKKWVLFFALLLLNQPVTLRAHGGEDHGSESPETSLPMTAGSSIYLSKESQFLLGVRTAQVQKQELRKRITTLGQLKPRSQGMANVVAFQSGRIISDEHFKIPQIGQRVQKGDIVAEIQVIDSFHIKAPISGVVTELDYTANEFVEAGKKLLTIVDPSILWVEANIYESDIPAVEGAQRAFIKNATYPEKEFQGRLITLGKVLDPESRSIKATFEIFNPEEKLRPGMFVDVSIETKSWTEALAVPSSAVLDKEGQTVVFIKMKSETFTMRTIEIGGQYEDVTAVKSGVQKGERVVVVGNYQLLTLAHTNRK